MTEPRNDNPRRLLVVLADPAHATASADYFNLVPDLSVLGGNLSHPDRRLNRASLLVGAAVRYLHDHPVEEVIVLEDADHPLPGYDVADLARRISLRAGGIIVTCLGTVGLPSAYHYLSTTPTKEEGYGDYTVAFSPEPEPEDDGEDLFALRIDPPQFIFAGEDLILNRDHIVSVDMSSGSVVVSLLDARRIVVPMGEDTDTFLETLLLGN